MSIKLPTVEETALALQERPGQCLQGDCYKVAETLSKTKTLPKESIDTLFAAHWLLTGLQIAETRRQVDQAEGSAMEETPVMRAVPERDEEIAGLASAESWRREKEGRHGD